MLTIVVVDRCSRYRDVVRHRKPPKNPRQILAIASPRSNNTAKKEGGSKPMIEAELIRMLFID